MEIKKVVGPRQEITAVVAVLKKRFNNLGAEELLALAWDIVEAIQREHAE